MKTVINLINELGDDIKDREISTSHGVIQPAIITRVRVLAHKVTIYATSADGKTAEYTINEDRDLMVDPDTHEVHIAYGFHGVQSRHWIIRKVMQPANVAA